MVSHTSVFPYARRFPLPHFIRLVSNYHSPLSLPLPSRRSRVPASAVVLCGGGPQTHKLPVRGLFAASVKTPASSGSPAAITRARAPLGSRARRVGHTSICTFRFGDRRLPGRGMGGGWGIPEGVSRGWLLQTVGAVCVRRNLRTLSAPIHVGAPSSPSSPGRPTYPLPPLRRMQESEGCSVSAVPGPQPGAPGPLVEAPPCTASSCFKGQEAREPCAREGSTWDPMPPTLPHLSLGACQC